MVRNKRKSRKQKELNFCSELNLSQGLINTIIVIAAFIPNSYRLCYSWRILMKMSAVVTWNM